MKTVGWQIVLIAAFAATATAVELRAGSWMLEIYRPDAPLDTRHISVVEADDGFAFADADGETVYFDHVRVVDGALEFEHPAFEEQCRLAIEPESSGWIGTCPPGNEPEFDAGLTITLRPPKQPLPEREEADGAAVEVSDADAVDAGIEEEDARAEGVAPEVMEEDAFAADGDASAADAPTETPDVAAQADEAAPPQPAGD